MGAALACREVRVVAGDGEMRAHQAQFNVRHDQRSTCVVTCLDGEVRVNRHSSVATLRAGQQVSYAALGLAAPMSVDPAEVTAWRDGMLIFHDAPLRNVVTEINRYRSGKVMVTNAELERRLVNGRFRIDNVDGILTMFQQIFGAKAGHRPGGLVLQSTCLASHESVHGVCAGIVMRPVILLFGPADQMASLGTRSPACGSAA